MSDIPQLSLDTLVKLSTHERRVVQESPQVEREPDPDDDEFPRMICLTVALDNGKQLDQDKLQAIMQHRGGEGGLVLVQRPK